MKLRNFKIVPFILAGAALLALSGCGSTGTPSDGGLTGTNPVVPVPPVPDPTTSTVIASPASVAADGTATSTVTVTVNDASSNPITDATVTLTQTGTSTISAVTNVGGGIYTFDVNSTTVATVTYTATANGIPITQTADVDFIGLPADITIDNAALQSLIASIFDDTYTPHINFQGNINQQGVSVSVPYTAATAVTLPAYSTSVTLDALVTENNETGIIATFAWAEQNLAQGSGVFTAAITIDDNVGSDPDGVYQAKKLKLSDTSGLVAATFPYATDDVGGTGTLTLKIIPGIPDRMFGIADNTGDDQTHMFIYMPVNNWKTGKTWLNNNLGANYANAYDASVFDPMQQATASNDYNAYGSLFQWGRKADGHELITWTDGSTGVGTNGTTTIQSDDPTDALFIIDPTATLSDWRVNSDDTLWASESSANNVCPVGYRVPTGKSGGELNLEWLSWGSADAAGALTSMLVLPMSGIHDKDANVVYNEAIVGYYWASTPSGVVGGADFNEFRSTSATFSTSLRAYGMAIRCIKD